MIKKGLHRSPFSFAAMTPVTNLAIVRGMKKSLRRDALKSLVMGGAAMATTQVHAAEWGHSSIPSKRGQASIP